MELKAFLSPDFHSNVYVLSGGKTLMIDAGQMPPGVRPDIIILTHCHFDHIARAKEIQDKTGCGIWMGAEEAEFFESDRRDASASRYFNIPAAPDFRITRRLKDGETIDIGETQDPRLKTIATPGHTPGGLCLYEPESKTLFSGDTVFAAGYGRYDLLGGDADALRASLAKLAKLDVETIYPGHGPALNKGVNEYLKSIII